MQDGRVSVGKDEIVEISISRSRGYNACFNINNHHIGIVKEISRSPAWLSWLKRRSHIDL